MVWLEERYRELRNERENLIKNRTSLRNYKYEIKVKNLSAVLSTIDTKYPSWYYRWMMNYDIDDM